MKVRTVDLILYFCMTDHLLMRSLRARKASIFLTSDFLFQIRFKISAFVHYLYIIIYNIDVLFRFLNEKTHLDNHFHNHSA